MIAAVCSHGRLLQDTHDACFVTPPVFERNTLDDYSKVIRDPNCVHDVRLKDSLVSTRSGRSRLAWSIRAPFSHGPRSGRCPTHAGAQSGTAMNFGTQVGSNLSLSR